MTPPQRDRDWRTIGLAGCAGCLGLLVVIFCAATVVLGAMVALERQELVAAEATANARLVAPAPSPTTAPLDPPTAVSTTAVLPTTTPTNSPPQVTLASTPDLQPRLSLQLPIPIEQRLPPAQALASLEALLAADYPPHDYYETAVRLGRRDVGPRVVEGPTFELGDRWAFRVDDEDEVTAVLVAVTEHSYFWVEDGLNLDRSALVQAANRFETEFYPRIVSLFGHEWRPGVDGDPRFSVLHRRDFRNNAELGYFQSADEYPRTIDDRSNEQELVYLNMDLLDVGEDLYFGTLVHELQHLIQWHLDSNEATWLDEGLAQLAELYVGLDTVETGDYLRRPSTPLNGWDYDQEEAIQAHYGAAYLFAVYFWEQLGDTAVQELARHPANGLAAVRAVLRGYRPDTTLEQFLADWVAATYLDDPAAGRKYAYNRLTLRRPSPVERVSRLPWEMDGALPQFGVDYVVLDRPGRSRITFAGDTLTPLIPDPPPSGERMWLSPGQDNVNARLTGRFDLRGATTATLNFWTWYELEDEYDFAYASVSVDGGGTWQRLRPEGAGGLLGEFGPGFNGRSANKPGQVGGWLPVSVSLDAYTGEEVLIRFDVLTDGTVSLRGFALDDIAIPELGFLDDAETDNGRWQAEGFVVTGQWLPQQWSVQLIEPGRLQVTGLALDPFNQGQWTVSLGPGGGVLAIMPLTPFARETAVYWLDVAP